MNEAKRNELTQPTGSVIYLLEGKCGNWPYRWEVIERRSSLETAQADEKEFRSWMAESGWHDLRIVKVTTTREILSSNNGEGAS